MECIDLHIYRAAVPNLFGTRDRFRGRQFFRGQGVREAVMAQAVMRAVESDGERQMKLRSLARRSPPAVRPGSEQAADCYRSTARGLGTRVLEYPLWLLFLQEVQSSSSGMSVHPTFPFSSSIMLRLLIIEQNSRN